MYKVMLVDDDYPVLELLSWTIEWESLGVVLQSTHENGASAFEKALEEMPDILITDIGMPKMNGIELTKRLKELNPYLQVIILSCHSEFDYAKQALKLQVHDYLVKDMFDPEDLCAVIQKVKENLDIQRNKNMEQSRLQEMLYKNRESLKERFIKRTIHQKQIAEKEWLIDAKAHGLHLDKRRYTPVLAFAHDFHLADKKYDTEDVLTFSINNILEDLMIEPKMDMAHFCSRADEFFLFVPRPSSFNIGSFDQTMEKLKKIQRVMREYLNIHLSYIIGNDVSCLEDLRQELSFLQGVKHQRFYMQPGMILKREFVQADTDDLFSKYDEASADIRELLLKREESLISLTVSKWITYIEEKKYPPEVVKEWMLKLLLDFKVKFHALQSFRSKHSADCLHDKILACDYLWELRAFVIDYFKSLLSLSDEVYHQTKRKEIMDAIRYVSINLEKRISQEEVAGTLYLNTSYFSRLFKKEMGETFVEYVTKMKMSRAKELLEQTADSVGKICERLGYDNQSYFIRLFKNHVGVTPIEFRGGKVS